MDSRADGSEAGHSRGRQPLIVGIDPGTTTAVAILSLKGDVLLTKSGKDLSRAAICRLILKAGDPIIVASDINPAPKSVHKIASLLGARLLFPEESLHRKAKKGLAEKMDAEEKRNRHEKDALAAALYAYKRIRPMTNKIAQELGREDEGLLESVSRKVIYERKNITKSIKEVEKN